MTYRALVLYFVVWLMLTASAARAETDLNITGQIRVRHETTKKFFDPDSAALDFTDLRTRVMIEAVIDGNTHAVVQFQDSRRFGMNDASGALTDTKNVDVHQAFVQVDRLWENGPGVKAGRFEVNLGNERVFGAVGWHNVGRVWEGMECWYDHASVRINGYFLKRLELNDPAGNRDFDVLGANADIKQAGLEVFGFIEHDADNAGLPEGMNMLDRYNLGAYFHRVFEQFDFTANGVYQFGKLPATIDATITELDIAAFLATFEAGYTIPGSAKARVAAGVDYSSGDDDADDDEFNAYNNLYYTGHRFRGFMDYFAPANVTDTTGLIDLMLRGKASPAPGWLIKADLHYFRSAAEYTNFEGEKTKDIGTELDFSVSTKKVVGVGLTAGASVFRPSESFAKMPDPDTRWWLYAMMTANF